MSKKLLTAALVIYCIYLLFHVSTHREDYQTDFKIYYYAAKAYTDGHNPYDPKVLFAMAQVPTHNKFVYPPFTLPFFRLFSIIKYEPAFFVFLSLKILLLAGLIYLWAKKLLQKDADFLFYVFCLLGYNSAIFLDVIASNVSIVEQFVLWLGFYFLLSRRPIPFCACVLAAALFKITPILFLFLVWIIDFEKKRKYAYFFGTATVFSFILLASYVIHPLPFKSFISNSMEIDERGIINPSTLAILKDAFDLLAIKTGATVPHFVPSVVFLFVISGILFLSWRSYTGMKFLNGAYREKSAIFFACLVYALILPRFKDYSYILLLVPTYFIIKRPVYAKVYVLFFSFTALSVTRVTLPGFPIIFNFLWRYYPLIIAYSAWGLYLRSCHFTRKAALGCDSSHSSTRHIQ